MSDYLQLSLLENEQESKSDNSRSCRVASPVSLTALQVNVNHLLMSVIYGTNSQESFAKLDQNGCWVKTCGDYCQANLDGSLEEFCGTFPKWGTVLGGAAMELPLSEPVINVRGCSLLPTPLASDGEAWKKLGKNDVQGSIYRNVHKKKFKGSLRTTYSIAWSGGSIIQAAEFYEMMMGFPKRWTELDV